MSISWQEVEHDSLNDRALPGAGENARQRFFFLIAVEAGTPAELRRQLRLRHSFVMRFSQ
jgi:hypothetical protein